MHISKRQRRYGLKAGKSIGEYFEENAHVYENQRWQDFKKQNPTKGKMCERCGSKSQIQRHHKISAIKCPDLIDNPHNIEYICRDCHNQEHNRRF